MFLRTWFLKGKIEYEEKTKPFKKFERLDFTGGPTCTTF